MASLADTWSLEENLSLATIAVKCIEENNVDWNLVSKKMNISNKGLNKQADFYSPKKCLQIYNSLILPFKTTKSSRKSKSGFNLLAAQELKLKIAEELKDKLKFEISSQVQAYKKLTRELDKIRKGEVATEQLKHMLNEQIRIDSSDLNLENTDNLDEEELKLVNLIKQFSRQPSVEVASVPKDIQEQPSTSFSEPKPDSVEMELTNVVDKVDDDVPLAAIAEAISPKKVSSKPIEPPSTRRSLRGTPIKTETVEEDNNLEDCATVAVVNSPPKKIKTDEKQTNVPEPTVGLKMKINLKGDTPAVENVDKLVTRRHSSRNNTSNVSETSNSPTTSPTRATRKSVSVTSETSITVKETVVPDKKEVPSVFKPKDLATIVKEFDKDEPVDYCDDITYRAWKSKVLAVLRRVAEHRHANLFAHPVTERDAPGYNETVKRPMDLTKIKKAIENGKIMSTRQFERDLLLMFVNAVMYNHSLHDVNKMAIQMANEALRDVQYYMSPANEDLSHIEVAKTRRSGRLNAPGEQQD